MSYIKNFFILLILLLSASSISFGDNVLEEKSFVNLKNLYLDESKFIQNDNPDEIIQGEFDLKHLVLFSKCSNLSNTIFKHFSSEGHGASLAYWRLSFISCVRSFLKALGKAELSIIFTYPNADPGTLTIIKEIIWE